MKELKQDDGGTTRIVQIGQVEIDSSKRHFDPESVAVLPTRNLILFPGVTSPITIVRPSSLKTAQMAMDRKMSIAIFCQKDAKIDSPSIDDLFPYGVMADILQIINLPDGGKAAIVHAFDKVKLLGVGYDFISDDITTARVKTVKDTLAAKNMPHFQLQLSTIKESLSTLIGLTGIEGANEFMASVENLPTPQMQLDMIATNFPVDPKLKIQMLAKNRYQERAMLLLEEVEHQLWIARQKEEIQSRARQSMEEQSRNAFLLSQMETIRQELYGDGDDADIIEEKAKNVPFPDNIRKTFEREVAKLRRLNPQSPDYSVLYSYLETLTDLPWQNLGELNNDFAKAAEILDNDHYGLTKVKERILEEFAMMLNNPGGKSPIICLVGPPGVGKTSIGRSVAAALGREYQRISLGGLHDESEIRGHRRTYIGAMPGRIIDALKRCKTSNPVLLLDEIDKIGKDFKGDPSAALLEVLDPAQNCHFHDNYIDVDYDLSNVLFIATANTLSTIAQPLLDRMEIIEIPGYLVEEKIEIAKRHLIPRLIAEAGPNSPHMTVDDDALKFIIEKYTSESGVRLFEKTLASILRKLILKKLQGKDFNSNITIDDVKELLGAEKYIREIYDGNEFAGVVPGLAWTAVGGEILFIESSLTPTKEGASKLTLTGNLGDVMKESAMIALQYVKAHAASLGIDQGLFERYSIHIHVPEGAVPKDGPSAGITMATSIVSAFTQKRVKERLAMTGEITLRGKVLHVGGIREKILAAKRAGLTDIILSNQNKKDIEEIEAQFIDGVRFHFVETVKDVIDIAITDEPAIDALTL